MRSFPAASKLLNERNVLFRMLTLFATAGLTPFTVPVNTSPGKGPDHISHTGAVPGLQAIQNALSDRHLRRKASPAGRTPATTYRKPIASICS